MATLFDRIQQQEMVRRTSTIRAGYKVYTSDEAYIGSVREELYLDPDLSRNELVLWIHPTPIIGADFPMTAANIASYGGYYPGRVALKCDWAMVLWLATKRFEEMETAGYSPEARGHHEATQIIETVNAQTFALLRKIRGVRQEAVRQFGELTEAEEALIQRIIDREIEAIDASVSTALRGITGMGQPRDYGDYRPKGAA